MGSRDSLVTPETAESSLSLLMAHLCVEKIAALHLHREIYSRLKSSLLLLSLAEILLVLRINLHYLFLALERLSDCRLVSRWFLIDLQFLRQISFRNLLVLSKLPPRNQILHHVGVR